MSKNPEPAAGAAPDLIVLARAPLSGTLRIVARLGADNVVHYAVEDHERDRSAGVAERSMPISREDALAVVAIADMGRRL